MIGFSISKHDSLLNYKKPLQETLFFAFVSKWAEFKKKPGALLAKSVVDLLSGFIAL